MTTYTLLNAEDKIFGEIADDGKMYVTFTKGDNYSYKALRKDVIENSGAALDVDVPNWLQEDADQTLFNRQLQDYTRAVARLAQYQVALGREEVTEMQDGPNQLTDSDGMPVFDSDGSPVYEQIEVVVQTAIDPVEPTIERTVYSDEDPDAEPTVETIENPLITQDNAERADAQQIVDTTPQPVIDHYNEQ